MKKVLCVFVCCMSLFSPFAVAEEQGIYFCTKDLGLLSSVSEENEYNLNEKMFNVSNELNNPYNTRVRHCFMLLATKIGEEHGYLYLSRDAAFGYGASDYDVMGKSGNVYDEPYVPRTTISCVPVFEKADIEETSKEDVFDMWLYVQRSMHKEQKRAEYNTVGHNCCTVAYQAVKDIGGHLERIEAASFNLKGMGILWGQTLGTIVSYASSFSSSTIVIVRASKHMFSSSSSSSEGLVDNEPPINQKTENEVKEEL